MKFSDIVGSLLSPSMTDSADLKDQLHAAVDSTLNNMQMDGRSSCAPPRRPNNCAIASRVTATCPQSSGSYAQDAMPYVANMDDYVKKDSIPCYGCNLK